ncbi:uncharacterized protein LOC131652136 [Vicia villosa]|uniref:uncharacterized protein LOC131652136 n=1 Tax=Vicia villosa TaxID=3911 RepID=UPI00273BA65A|nr:uncharacterized protein LOC131652136 [Vicia villosa]
MALVLLEALKKTNRLIQQQSERIDKLERKLRSRSPPRRRHRSRSSSSSRSPPRRHRRRSPSSSRSPPKRYCRRRSDSRSPRRKNQKPEEEETGSPSPERGHRGPTKAVVKGRECSPPEDNRKTSGKTQGKPRRKHNNRRRHSNSLGPSDEEDFRNPLSEDIRRARLPRGMEKPPTLDLYDGTTDPDDHIQSIEAVMDYHVVRGSIKCRIFPTTLRKGAMTWYKNLPPNSIHSWSELNKFFSNHFTASRRQPKSEATLEAVIQGANEPLREYLDRFNKEVVQVQTSDHMKRYLLERGLLPGSDFKKAIKIEKVRTMDALLLKAQAYIAYEEGEAAVKKSSRGNDTTRNSSQDYSLSLGGNKKRKDDRPRDNKE